MVNTTASSILSSVLKAMSRLFIFQYHIFCFFLGLCEQQISNLEIKIPMQQRTIRAMRSQKQRLEEEAKRLRAEADSACIRGQSNRELGLMNNSRRLLEEGEFMANFNTYAI